MSYHCYADADAQCPFYMEQGGISVKCEGIAGRGSIQINFSNGQEKAKWLARHCNRIKGCRKCPLWKALWTEWEKAHPDSTIEP